MNRKQWPVFAGWMALAAMAGGGLKTMAATVAIVTDAPLPLPAAAGLGEFESALKAKGHAIERRNAAPGGEFAIVVGVAGASPCVDRLLREETIDLGKAPESLCLRRLGNGWLVAGRDARGLNFALREAARAVELGGLAGLREAVESPQLRTRSLSVHLMNRDLEAAWYFDEAFWRSYFALLARSRFNNLILTFADQTNYLCPPYPWLVGVAAYPQVRVEGLAAGERAKNLAMLRRIAELADESGLDFTIGLWMQAPVKKYVGEILVRGLPEGPAASDYGAAALREVLRACPAIDGVQFRMNAESGVAEDRQREFYAPLFRSIREAGRPLRLELRFKGLRPETIREAVAMGIDTTVSTKFWAEHLGQPWHPTAVDSHYRGDRYSFGALLAKPRDFRVTYQLWNVGTQRLLLWGDPDYAAKFARACRLGGGEGFEVFAPLTNRGFGNAPGNWAVFADPAHEVGRWPFERHWFFHLLFGRLGYNPETEPEIWRRELRHRFGGSAGAAETAFTQASRILPLVTAARLPSASEWSWWPEMDTGDRLPEYARTQPSDPARYYAIRSWKRTTDWRFEDWDEAIPGFVEDAVAGNVSAKVSPPEVSRELGRLARETTAALERIPAAARLQIDPDLAGLAALGEFHAAKTLAAVDWAFFDETGDADRLPRALAQMGLAAVAWERLVKLTDGVYHDNLVFGYGPEHRRTGGYHQTGHWQDRLAEVREDAAMLGRLVAKTRAVGVSVRTYPGEMPLPARARPRLEPVTVPQAKAGADLVVKIRVACDAPLRGVTLHFRPLNQTIDWQQRPMRDTGGGVYEGTIPGAAIVANFDLQYYVEALVEGGGAFWPPGKDGPPYVLVETP